MVPQIRVYSLCGRLHTPELFARGSKDEVGNFHRVELTAFSCHWSRLGLGNGTSWVDSAPRMYFSMQESILYPPVPPRELMHTRAFMHKLGVEHFLGLGASTFKRRRGEAIDNARATMTEVHTSTPTSATCNDHW